MSSAMNRGVPESHIGVQRAESNGREAGGRYRVCDLCNHHNSAFNTTALSMYSYKHPLARVSDRIEREGQGRPPSPMLLLSSTHVFVLFTPLSCPVVYNMCL
ncbi:hypothetical protein FKM82_024121 [Ascaphus truei]